VIDIAGADHPHGIARQGEFLLGLAQGGGDGILARIDLAAGKGDLPRDDRASRGGAG
jgi:hypothetical protein